MVFVKSFRIIFFKAGNTLKKYVKKYMFEERHIYMNKQPHCENQKELTPVSIVTGVLLAVIFGAANAYLGLRVGMTISASIPAAVVSMSVIRVILRRDSLLESNMVQTIGSAGESLAAGAIFTLPVLFLWSVEGVIDTPSLLTIALISLCGGVLGVLFMVPLRGSLIVKEEDTLPYPEGKACAEVLLAGEKGGAGALFVFGGMGFSALVKLITDGLKLIPATITLKVNALKTEVSTQIYPALLGVGYLCGARIAAYMFAGGILGWLVLIPMINTFGESLTLYPAEVPIAQLYAKGGASAIWSTYIRYIGAGAVAAGGIISLLKSLPLIGTTFVASIKGLSDTKSGKDRTQRDLSMRTILLGIVLMTVVIWLLPPIPVTFLGAVLIVLFGFFFATVSARMVGLVGSSNNPVSGMAIATLLFTTLILKATGDGGAHGMKGAIAIGSIICIVAAMAGDTSQDLKTGYLLGATPKKQQIGELIGSFFSALTIGAVLILLDRAWGFGSEELSAPQATLMKLIIEGIMNGSLPWTLVFIGAFTALAVEALSVPVLPVAIGLYLPLELSFAILFGGMVRSLADRRQKKTEAASGILFCSGLIAGEGIVGILLAVLTILGFADGIDLSGRVSFGAVGAGVVLICSMGLIYFVAAWRNKGSNKTGHT